MDWVVISSAHPLLKSAKSLLQGVRTSLQLACDSLALLHYDVAVVLETMRFGDLTQA